MQIHQFYEQILAALNLVSDQYGLISVKNDEDDLRPVMIDEARLTLPLPEILRSGEWGNRIAFHPLSENVVRGPSPVIEKTKTAVRIRLTYALSGLMYGLVEAAADRSKHHKINPKAAAFLQCLPEADEKSVAAMVKILQAIDNESVQLISIYLKRGGTYNGDRVSRLAKVTFPILNEFDNVDGMIFGVKLRKKDQVGFKELFKYILPDADVMETYSGVGSSLTAPYFQALIDAFIKVAKQLNSIIQLQRKQLEDEDFLHMDLSWESEFRDFEKFSGLIPPLAGNDGAPTTEEPNFKSNSGGVKIVSASTSTPGSAFTTPTKIQNSTLSGTTARAAEAPTEESTGFNRDFSLSMRKQEEAVEEARRTVWSNWQQQTQPLAAVTSANTPPFEVDGNTKIDIRGKKGLDFNKIMAARMQAANPVAAGFGFQVATVAAPGTYAGHHRGVPIAPVFSGFGNYTNPNNGWTAAPIQFQGGFAGSGLI